MVPVSPNNFVSITQAASNNPQHPYDDLRCSSLLSSFLTSKSAIDSSKERWNQAMAPVKFLKQVRPSLLHHPLLIGLERTCNATAQTLFTAFNSPNDLSSEHWVSFGRFLALYHDAGHSILRTLKEAYPIEGTTPDQEMLIKRLSELAKSYLQELTSDRSKELSDQAPWESLCHIATQDDRSSYHTQQAALFFDRLAKKQADFLVLDLVSALWSDLRAGEKEASPLVKRFNRLARWIRESGYRWVVETDYRELVVQARSWVKLEPPIAQEKHGSCYVCSYNPFKLISLWDPQRQERYAVRLAEPDQIGPFFNWVALQDSPLLFKKWKAKWLLHSPAEASEEVRQVLPLFKKLILQKEQEATLADQMIDVTQLRNQLDSLRISLKGQLISHKKEIGWVPLDPFALEEFLWDICYQQYGDHYRFLMEYTGLALHPKYRQELAALKEMMNQGGSLKEQGELSSQSRWASSGSLAAHAGFERVRNTIQGYLGMLPWRAKEYLEQTQKEWESSPFQEPYFTFLPAPYGEIHRSFFNKEQILQLLREKAREYGSAALETHSRGAFHLTSQDLCTFAIEAAIKEQAQQIYAKMKQQIEEQLQRGQRELKGWEPLLKELLADRRYAPEGLTSPAQFDAFIDEKVSSTNYTDKWCRSYSQANEPLFLSRLSPLPIDDSDEEEWWSDDPQLSEQSLCSSPLKG